MTNQYLLKVVLLFSALSLGMFAQETRSEPPYGPGVLCDEVVTALYPRWIPGASRDRLARVEVRNCRLEGHASLQIAAWSEGAIRPDLLVHTNGIVIQRAVIDGNVFVLETEGASNNIFHVVIYDRGKPRLVFHDATRADVRIETTGQRVIIRWPQEKAPDRVYEFQTGEY
jgi:hypothetical protein